MSPIHQEKGNCQEGNIFDKEKAMCHFQPRSLSDISGSTAIALDLASFFRSFSLNSHHYSPQTLEKSASNQHNLATIPNIGQAPRKEKALC